MVLKTVIAIITIILLPGTNMRVGSFLGGSGTSGHSVDYDHHLYRHMSTLFLNIQT